MGWHYLRAQERVDVLLRTLDHEAWVRSVRACPGWRVRDVLAHLVGTPEDAVAGRLDGLPTTEQTAEQVERHRHDDPVDLLDQWLAMGPMVAAAVTASGLWPAAIDAVTHEQDLRAALDRPGARDVPSVDLIADMLGRLVEAPVPVVFDLGDRQVESAVEEGTGAATPSCCARPRSSCSACASVAAAAGRSRRWTGRRRPSRSSPTSSSSGRRPRT